MGTRRSNGEGHIKQYGDGWRGYITVSGTRLYRRGRTRKAVVDALQKARAEALAPPPPNSLIDDIDVTTYLGRWISSHRTRIKSSTADRYESLFRFHVQPILGDRLVRDIRFSDVDSVIAGIQNKGLSRSTAAQVRTLLNQAFHTAYRDGLLVTNPAHGVRLPKIPQTEILIIPDKHRDAILAEAAKRGLRDLGRRRLSLFYGLRQGEVLSLQWDDIKFDDGTLFVRSTLSRVGGALVRSTPKTAYAHRVIRLNDATLDVLKQVRREQDLLREVFEESGGDPKQFNPGNFVFVTSSGRPIDPRNDHRQWKADCQRASKTLKEDVPAYRLHDARHTVGTGLIASGIDPVAVSRFLGHSSVSFTLRTYVHRSAVDVSDAEAALLTGSFGNPLAASA